MSKSLTITRGQDRVKTPQALLDRKVNLDAKHAEENAVDAGFWAIVNPIKNEYKTIESGREKENESFRQRYKARIIDAGEYLEQHACPQERIARRLINEFGFVYKATNIAEILHSAGKDTWFREYERDQGRINEIVDTLTNNVVILRIDEALEATVLLSDVLNKMRDKLYDVTLDREIRWEILEEIAKNETIMIGLKNHTTSIMESIQDGNRMFDAREDITVFEKVMNHVSLLAFSIRECAGIYEKSTKWIGKLLKGRVKGLAHLFCPACYTDLVPLVTEIYNDGNKRGAYLLECKRLDPEGNWE